MYEIQVEGWFSAAHQLRLLDGQLEPLHGHNWHVRVTYAGAHLDGMDVLLDFTRLKPSLDRVLSAWHDRNLNDLPEFSTSNPSAEMVARRLFELLGADDYSGAALDSVEVVEAPGCRARYNRDVKPT